MKRNSVKDIFKQFNNTMKINLFRLFIGMIPNDIPMDLFFPGLQDALNDKNYIVLNSVKNKLKISFENFIKEFNKLLNNPNLKYKDKFIFFRLSNHLTPDYIYSNGVEPIKYNDFKYSNQLRLMGIENPLIYLTFIYNTMIVFRPLFTRLYNKQNNQKLLNTSNSPILNDKDIINNNSYKDAFAKGNDNFNKNLIKKSLIESTYPCYMTLDIQSFFPNIYTHNFNQIKNDELFKSIKTKDTSNLINNYFKFLDKYNMKNNEDKTKGIVVGPISSVISSELLSLDIYDQASKKYPKMFNNIMYSRYMDDVIVFSKHRSTLHTLHLELSKFLQKYELRFQDEKFKIVKGIYIPKSANFASMIRNVPFLVKNKRAKFTNVNDFISFKIYVKFLIDHSQYTTLKALFSTLGNKKIRFTSFSNVYEDIFIDFCLKLAITYPCLSCSIYKFLELQMKLNNPEIGKDYYYDKNIYQRVYNTLGYVNEFYDGTVIQIWTFYLLNLYYDKYLRINSKYKLFVRYIKYCSKNFRTRSIYPLVIMCFISKHNGKKFNEHIVNNILNSYIKEYVLTYTKELKNKNEDITSIDNSKLKSLKHNIFDSIIFSKWSFPIYKLYSIDTSNKYLKFIFKTEKEKDKISCLFDIISSNFM